MKANRGPCALVALIALAGGTVPAQSSPCSVRIGPAAVRLSVSATPESPKGAPIPGAALEADNGTTLSLEIGYDLTPDWTGRLTVGVVDPLVLHAGATYRS